MPATAVSYARSPGLPRITACLACQLCNAGTQPCTAQLCPALVGLPVVAALVFCATKRGAEAEAARLASQLAISEPAEPPPGAAAGDGSIAEGGAGSADALDCSGGSLEGQSSLQLSAASRRADFAARLQELGEPKAGVLAELVLRGVAFHNSGGWGMHGQSGRMHALAQCWLA